MIISKNSSRKTNFGSVANVQSKIFEDSVSDEFIVEPDPDFYLSNLFGYRCVNVKMTDGIYEIFEPTLKILASVQNPFARQGIEESKSESEFSGYEDSDEDKLGQSLNFQFQRGSSNKSLVPKDKIMQSISPLMREYQANQKESLTNLNHSQTVESEIPERPLINKSSLIKYNISQYDGASGRNSSIIKLTKDRWNKLKAKRKLSMNLLKVDAFNQDNNEPDITSSDYEGEGKQTHRRNASAKRIPNMKVDKNMKYLLKLKRSKLLKNTLLGRMVSYNLLIISST